MKPNNPNTLNEHSSKEQIEQLIQAAQQQAKQLLDKLPVIGPVVWVMLQHEQYRSLTLAQIESRILAPAVLNQMRLFMHDNTLPVAYASWAYLNEEVATKFKQGNYALAPNEWKCGDECWLVDLVCSEGDRGMVMGGLAELKLNFVAR